MYLSYLDESGTPGDRNTRFFVLGGVLLFERQTHWLERALDAIADRYQQRLGGRYLELHAGPMRSGREGWENLSPADRAQATADVLRLLQTPGQKLKVFAAAVEKSQFLRTADILPYCYEVLAAKVDAWLAWRFQAHQEAARGIFVFDRKQSDEAGMQALHHTFKHVGHTNGRLRNFAEVPLFIDSKASRLIQLADTVCYWIYRRYEAGDDRGWQLIAPYFANLGSGRTGLHEALDPATPAMLNNPTPQVHPFPPPLSTASRPMSAVSSPQIAPLRLVPTALITP